MARRKQEPRDQKSLLDITDQLRTAPCVPALREAVKAWRAGGYKGVTDTTRELLNYWFETDHKLGSGGTFRYYEAQREAIEALIFVWEFEKVRTSKDLLERYAVAGSHPRLLQHDQFARYCTKMATGSGKTKVMSLAVAWQYLNAARGEGDDYAKTFLIIAPNVIVLERLKTDFQGGWVFQVDPVVPKTMETFWDFACVIRGEGEGAHYDGTLFLTNVQQFYPRPDRQAEAENEEMTGVLGSAPPTKKLEISDFRDRIALRGGKVMVLNDEAHHTHEEDNEWNKAIRRVHEQTPLMAQLDFSATPRFNEGEIFPWTISDYPLKQAIIDGIVKRPMKGVADIPEAASEIASVRYAGFLTAGIERWKEYRGQLAPLSKKPVLFLMLTDTEEADEVGDWLRTKYPDEFGGQKTLIIHTKKNGEIRESELEDARKAARDVDDETSPVNAIVSVLMLREGWDVKNVTVVVGLRPYSAKAKILPEQTIGRGLRLMFRDTPPGSYTEKVDIIGNKAFLEFVDDLGRLEEMAIGEFKLGGEKLKIITIQVMEEKAEYDIGLPLLTPSLVRKTSLAEEIARLDVMGMQCPTLPMKAGDAEEKTFHFEGYDFITLEKEIERDYKIPQPQTPQEVIGYYARRIAQEVKLPAQFAALAPRVREFFEHKAFGKTVELNEATTIKAMSTPHANYVCIRLFAQALRDMVIDEQEPELLTPARMLSTMAPFPWSRPHYEAQHCILNLVPCDNDFERRFAIFLDKAPDVVRFSKLPLSFGFAIEYLDGRSNLRSYYPDFVAVDDDGVHWLLETKGQEDITVAHKDQAAEHWCENATELTNTEWRYRKVPQEELDALAPTSLGDLDAFKLL